jgi:hypothetical protein
MLYPGEFLAEGPVSRQQGVPRPLRAGLMVRKPHSQHQGATPVDNSVNES